MKKEENKGQVKLSFGMIFSIILIIVFLVFAFLAIRTFIGIKDTAQTEKFLNDFQGDVDRVWRSSQSSETQEYFLTNKVESVCFVEFDIPSKGSKSGTYDELERAYYGSENLVFYPFGSSSTDSAKIENIDIGAITASENPFCIENINGKVNLRLVKDFNDALVTVTQ